jgi:hypothetical protein
MTAQAVNFSIVAATAPSWFANQTVKTWVAKATGGVDGNRFSDVMYAGSLYSGGASDVVNAWTGGCVDQARGELLLVAGGGHNGYGGNEGYAFAARREVPTWYRLNEPSPTSMITPFTSAPGFLPESVGNRLQDQGSNCKGYAAMWADGRARPTHSSGCLQYANGRVWVPIGTTPNTVDGSQHAWSFNRGYQTGTGAGQFIPTAPGGTPMAWTNDAGPWVWLGTTDTGDKSATARAHAAWRGTLSFEPSAYDPVTGLIWTMKVNDDGIWSSLNTGAVSGTAGAIQSCSAPTFDSNNTGQGWSVVVYDTVSDRWRFRISWCVYLNQLQIHDLKNSPYARSSLSYVNVNAAGVTALNTAASGGAVYHKPSKAILLGNPLTLGGNILKIKPPLNGDGSFAGGAWTVTTITPASGSATPAPGSQQSYTKFNMIEDMGNGQSALVSINQYNGATYIYKLPTTEIS